jgi:hypothetical protein
MRIERYSNHWKSAGAFYVYFQKKCLSEYLKMFWLNFIRVQQQLWEQLMLELNLAMNKNSKLHFFLISKTK